MATLHVQNVPDDLYERLKLRARAEKRSLSAEVVSLLERAIGEPPPERVELLERIRRRRSQIEPMRGRLSASLDLLREDRAR
jgi:plasmid stability protein